MTIHFGWPQGIMVLLVLWELVTAAVRHGKETRINAFHYAIWYPLLLALMAWGGFFR